MAALLAPSDYWWSWGDLAFRWLHVIAGIAWIGSSFYFIALDNHLEPPAEERDAARGVAGEVWEIHGGGFYRIEKFRVAPHTLPEKLYWFKWEAYTTWLSGFALLIVVYFAHASTFLVDRSVADLATWQAIAIAVGGLALAWIVYDGLCRLLGGHDGALAVAVFAFVVLAAWGASQLLAPRAAYIEVGAMLGTVMAANVFFVIIPAHRELIRAREAGREPDPRWNARAKQRSVHNNYLTLPVVFAMLSNHFPFTYGSSHAWLVLVALMALGAWIRHYFNLRHRGRNAWWIPVSAAAGLIAVAVLIRPATTTPSSVGPPPSFATVQAIVANRCAPCHSPTPTQPGYSSPPAGIVLDTPAQIEDAAALIGSVAVDSQAMPLGNATGMTRPSATRSPAGSPRGSVQPPMLEIVAAGFAFRARFEEAAAPGTVAAFRAILPFEDRLIHCRWSGESNWIPWGDRELGLGPENATCYPAPGQLLLYPGGVSETELLFPYGHCAFASKAGALAGNHFATVVEGGERFAELGRLTLWEGAQPISFREA